jgi:hypothetical protein
MQMCLEGHGFRRMRCFNIEGAERTISVASWHGNHYDFLFLRPGNLEY